MRVKVRVRARVGVRKCTGETCCTGGGGAYTIGLGSRVRVRVGDLME